jgi:pSer/pThr/pTyr-binding forkhead associated (FHA) protein
MNAPRARLEVVAGKALGMSIIVDNELLIGRHADGAGRLADDAEISRSHARVSLDRSGFCAIEDLGSTNGTFVNGLRIAAPATLSEGDTVELGGTTLVVRELPDPATERSLTPIAPRPTGAPGTADLPTQRMTDKTPPATRQAGRGSMESNPQPAPAPATLSLRLEIDFSTREATVSFGDGSEAVRLVLDHGAWRPASDSN